MKFYRGLMWVGTVVAVLGFIILIFQATLYFSFDVWYDFSILDILERIGLRNKFYTGVEGFDDTVDWLLHFPLPLVLLGSGCFIGLVAFKRFQDEKAWYRAP